MSNYEKTKKRLESLVARSPGPVDAAFLTNNIFPLIDDLREDLRAEIAEALALEEGEGEEEDVEGGDDPAEVLLASGRELLTKFAMLTDELGKAAGFVTEGASELSPATPPEVQALFAECQAGIFQWFAGHQEYLAAFGAEAGEAPAAGEPTGGESDGEVGNG